MSPILPPLPLYPAPHRYLHTWLSVSMGSTYMHTCSVADLFRSSPPARKRSFFKMLLYNVKKNNTNWKIWISY